MKNQNSTANTNFWKTLAIMFGIFILIAGSILFIANSFAEDNDVAGKQIIVVQQQTPDDTNDSFDAVKDRVNEVNGNYGQNIKSSYAGDSSTMEAMAKQRMFFSGLKSTLIIILLITVILVVLVKGFNLTLWKKAKKPLNAGDSEKTDEGRKEPKPTPKKPQEKAKPVQKKTVKEKPKNETKTESTEEVVEEDDSSEEEDVQMVTDVCQLP